MKALIYIVRLPRAFNTSRKSIVMPDPICATPFVRIEDALDRFRLTARYSALPSEEEIGGKRGCVVLMRNGRLADTLISVMLLR